MVGKGCVAIACDLRLGNQALTVACNFEKVRPHSLLLARRPPHLPLTPASLSRSQVFAATDRTYFGLPGLASDTITVRDKLRQRVNLYGMKEERTIEPETFCHLVSSTLYERRFGPYFVEPVVAGASRPSLLSFGLGAERREKGDADTFGLRGPLSLAGLNSKDEPFIAATDLIGCINFAKARRSLAPLLPPAQSLTSSPHSLPLPILLAHSLLALLPPNARRTLSSRARRPKSCSAWPSRCGSPTSSPRTCSRR